MACELRFQPADLLVRLPIAHKLAGLRVANNRHELHKLVVLLFLLLANRHRHLIGGKLAEAQRRELLEVLVAHVLGVPSRAGHFDSPLPACRRCWNPAFRCIDDRYAARPDGDAPRITSSGMVWSG